MECTAPVRGVEDTQARERLAAPQQQGAGWWRGAQGVMGPAGTEALSSGGLGRAIFKRSPAFHPARPWSLLSPPRWALDAGRSQLAVLHL